MEFLKELFGEEPLTYDQLAAKVAEKKMKLADISGGAYVGKYKFDTLLTEKNGLQERLDEANGKLSGYDPEWKAKAEQAQAEAEAWAQQQQWTDPAPAPAPEPAPAPQPGGGGGCLNDGLVQ